MTAAIIMASGVTSGAATAPATAPATITAATITAATVAGAAVAAGPVPGSLVILAWTAATAGVTAVRVRVIDRLHRDHHAAAVAMLAGH